MSGPVNDIINVFSGFGVNLSTFVPAFVNFIVVCAILAKFAVKPIIGILEQRKEMIEDSVKKAEEVDKQLSEANQIKAQKIDDANQQAKEIVEAAKKVASEIKDKAVLEAQSEATSIKDKAHAASEQERDAMLKKAKSQVASLVMSVTSSVIDRTLTSDDQNRINDAASKEIAA